MAIDKAVACKKLMERYREPIINEELSKCALNFLIAEFDANYVGSSEDEEMGLALKEAKIMSIKNSMRFFTHP